MMENWFLSDKDKSNDIEWLMQYNEQFFDAAANLLKSKDEKSLSDDNVKLNRIRIPNLSLQSVYHLPQTSPIQSELTESTLSKLESEYVILEEQFKPYLDTINSEKRFNLIRFLLLLYYSRLNNATKQSKLYFCDMCLKICKINRSTLKNQSIYLNSQILIEMLNCLYFLFNNNLEVDAYIAIESIAYKADEEMMVDVILMCNSIKNLIQQSKTEPSIQNALANAANSTQTKMARSGSIISNRKKSIEKSSPVGSNLNYRGSFLNAMNNDSGSNSLTSFVTNSNEVYISPSTEMRNAAKTAAEKLQHQIESVSLNDSNSIKSTITSNQTNDQNHQVLNKKNDHDNIPIIDDTSGDNCEDDSSSNQSLYERL